MSVITTARTGIRLLSLVAVLGATILLALAVSVCPSRRARRNLARRGLTTCCRWLLGALGVQRLRGGPTPPAGALLLANHLSWLDIPLVLASYDCTFVAKHEVRRWPGIGVLGNALGVIWIERRRPRDLLRVIPILEAALRAGQTVLLFPEGTTTNGHTVLPFRSGLLDAAVRANAPVLPIALSGAVRRGNLDALCWHGTESLVANVPRVAALEGARMRAHVGAPLGPVHDRKRLARAARDQLLRRFRRALHHNMMLTTPPTYVPSARAKQNFRPIESSDREILA